MHGMGKARLTMGAGGLILPVQLLGCRQPRS
jgi:hypothetical protein